MMVAAWFPWCLVGGLLLVCTQHAAPSSSLATPPGHPPPAVRVAFEPASLAVPYGALATGLVNISLGETFLARHAAGLLTLHVTSRDDGVAALLEDTFDLPPQEGADGVVLNVTLLGVRLGRTSLAFHILFNGSAQRADSPVRGRVYHYSVSNQASIGRRPAPRPGVSDGDGGRGGPTAIPGHPARGASPVGKNKKSKSKSDEINVDVNHARTRGENLEALGRDLLRVSRTLASGTRAKSRESSPRRHGVWGEAGRVGQGAGHKRDRHTAGAVQSRKGNSYANSGVGSRKTRWHSAIVGGERRGESRGLERSGRAARDIRDIRDNTDSASGRLRNLSLFQLTSSGGLKSIRTHAALGGYDMDGDVSYQHVSIGPWPSAVVEVDLKGQEGEEGEGEGQGEGKEGEGEGQGEGEGWRRQERWDLAEEYEIIVSRDENRIQWYLEYAALTLMALCMLGIGGQLDLHEVLQHVKTPKVVSLALFCRFGLMPALGLGLVELMKPDKGVSLGVLGFLCAPSEGASCLMLLLAEQDLSTSVTVATIINFATVAMMPLWTIAYEKRIFSRPGLVKIPFRETFLVFGYVAAASMAGYYLQQKWPKLSARLAAFLPSLAILTLLFRLVIDIYTDAFIFHLVTAEIFLLSAILAAAGYVCGCAVAFVARQPPGVMVILAIETGSRTIFMTRIFLSISLASPEADMAQTTPVLAGLLSVLPACVTVLVVRTVTKFNSLSPPPTDCGVVVARGHRLPEGYSQDSEGSDQLETII